MDSAQALSTGRATKQSVRTKLRLIDLDSTPVIIIPNLQLALVDCLPLLLAFARITPDIRYDIDDNGQYNPNRNLKFVGQSEFPLEWSFLLHVT
jgi:hypothetical protein